MLSIPQPLNKARLVAYLYYRLKMLGAFNEDHMIKPEHASIKLFAPIAWPQVVKDVIGKNKLLKTPVENIYIGAINGPLSSVNAELDDGACRLVLNDVVQQLQKLLVHSSSSYAAAERDEIVKFDLSSISYLIEVLNQLRYIDYINPKLFQF